MDKRAPSVSSLSVFSITLVVQSSSNLFQLDMGPAPTNSSASVRAVTPGPLRFEVVVLAQTYKQTTLF